MGFCAYNDDIYYCSVCETLHASKELAIVHLERSISKCTNELSRHEVALRNITHMLDVKYEGGWHARR